MSKRWLAFCKPYLDRLMAWARKDTDVSYDDYNRLSANHNKIYNQGKK